MLKRKSRREEFSLMSGGLTEPVPWNLEKSMTDTSISVGHTGAEAHWPAEGETLPSFLSADRDVGQAAERDFRLGHVFAQTFSTLRRHLLPFFLLFVIPSFALNIPVTFTQEDSPFADVAIAMGISQVLYAVFGAFAGAAVAYAAVNDMRGRPVDMSAALRVALRRFFPALGVTFIVLVLAFIGLPFLFFPAAIVISVYFVVVPACVVEELGPMQSLRRSAVLTKGYRWRIFGLWFAIPIIEAIVQSQLDQAARPFGNNTLILAPQVLWDMVVGAFLAVAAAVTYRDLRIAKEGIEPDQVVTVFD